jgi:hypothetical protein
MPRCKGRTFDQAGGPSRPCTYAGLPHKASGERLCAEHARRGDVTNTDAGALASAALKRPVQLPPGPWSLWNRLGADSEDDRLGELTDVDKAALRAACDGELRRRCTEPPGNLTRSQYELNAMLTEAALGMLAPTAAVVDERAAVREELDAEVPGYGWPALKTPIRHLYPTAGLSTIALNLAPFEPAAAQQLAEQQQPPPATSLADVLEALEIRADELTKSNVFIQGFALGDSTKKDVILIDRPDVFIILHYDPHSQGQNYLLRPASTLRREDKPGDATSEADLTALLCLVFAQQKYSRIARRSEVVAAFKIRDDQVVLSESFKIHPELWSEPKPGAPVRTDCTLATYRRELDRSSTAPGSEPATDSQLSKREVSEFREKLVYDVMRRHAAARGTNHFWLAAQIDHSIPCWLTTYLLMQFFGPENLGDLSPADKLWLYEVVKSLHNGSTNAMMVSEVRNQYHVPLSVLLAMGYSMGDITSGRSGQQCVTRSAKHTHTREWIDFSSSFAPLPLAVDAATMLEAFHSYGQELHRIGKRQPQGSQRRKATFVLAKWFFDTGDRARLPRAP